ncbi:diguanylate cyclase [Halomonas sp. HP20-15]|uniref:GGDEF domain-containing protein n=1 Tax=Halomonas sp. HP20-15 TaxID=3085901 RepID=UPI002980E33C|nr:diguanylate cyclase [Halomonas sp. HP20-15]MDW5377141.1 diguanylate cyclase [Halomonas sp. HP20-15]
MTRLDGPAATADDAFPTQENDAGQLSDKELARLGPAIDDTLARGLSWLRFSPALETLFELETSAARARQLIMGGWLAVILYNAFLFTDYLMLPDIFETAALIRVAVITPLTLLFMAALKWGVRPLTREALEALIILVSASSLIVLLSLSEAPSSTYYHSGLALFIIYGNVVVRLRFWYALATSLAIVALYTAVPGSVVNFPPNVRLVNVITVGSCAAFTLFANYALEYDLRRSYLDSLCERVRRAKLSVSNRELTRLSHSDPLTGIANRRELDRYLRDLQQSPQYPAVAAIAFDIDYFKAYNDLYGHPAGDHCLAQVALILHGRLARNIDLVARTGGEEFVVLLPGASQTAALVIADGLRQAIEDAAIPHAASPVASVVTLSAGVAQGSFKNAPHAVLAGADAALYRAKLAGRNRTSD